MESLLQINRVMESGYAVFVPLWTNTGGFTAFLRREAVLLCGFPFKSDDSIQFLVDSCRKLLFREGFV